MDTVAVDRKTKKRTVYKVAQRSKNGPSTGVKKIRCDAYRIWPTWISTETSTTAKTRIMNPTPVEVEDMADEGAPCTAVQQSLVSEDSSHDELNRQITGDAELLSLLNELQETDKVDKPSLKFSENWKNKYKDKSAGLSKVSSNESTKRGRRKAVMELLGKLQRDSGGEFILFSRYPNKKKVSSFVDILGANAKEFMTSEVGKGIEKIWHRDSDKLQSDRNKSAALTPPADTTHNLPESDSNGNSTSVVSQDESLSDWNNQMELALVDGSLAQSASVSDDPTANSLHEDNGSLSNYDSEQWILVESGDQPTTEVQPVSLVGVVPQRKRVNKSNQQVRVVAPAPQKKTRQTCNGPSVKFSLQKMSTGKEAATAPLPNPPAPQRPSVSTNRSNSAPVGRTVSINSQARLIKVFAVPPGSKITSIVLPSSSK